MRTAFLVLNILITIATVVGLYFFVPVAWIDEATRFLHPTKFGATITSIAGTDTLSSSRSVINTNFSNLNTAKLEEVDIAATTSLPQLTTLAGLTSAAALATIGTITSGTWHGTTITAQYGGTGSTTLSSNELLVGNGTGNVVSVGWGTNGQFLQSQGAAAIPVWASSAVDQTAAYSWTGIHNFLANVFMSSTTIGTLNVGRVLATSTLPNVFTNASTTNLTVATLASTTNLTVSGTCTGCTLPTIVSSANASCSASAGATCSQTTSCSGSQKVSGGGFTTSNANSESVTQNYPSATNAWTTTVSNLAAAGAGTLTVYAVCVNP